MPDELLATLEAIHQGMALLRMGGHGNPNHKGSGPGGGQFASGPGGGGATAQHGKHWAKRQRQKAKRAKQHTKERQKLRKTLKGKSYSERRKATKSLRAKHSAERKSSKPSKKSVTATGGGKAVDTRVPKRERTEPPKPKDEARGERAKAVYDAAKSNVHVVRYGEKQEAETIKKIGGRQGSDNGAVDIVRRVGGIEHGIEHKVIVNKGGPNKSGTKAQVKMEADQLQRKNDWLAAKSGRRSGMIVLDHRDRATNEAGEHIGNKEAYSGHEIYYRRDYGAHRLGSMYKAKSMAEVKSLMGKSDEQLRAMVKADPKYKGVIRMTEK